MKNISKLFAGLSLSVAIVACGGTAQKEDSKASTNETERPEKKEITAEQASYEVLPDQSDITWAGVLMGVYTHKGTVQLEKGVIELKGDEIVGGEFIVDMSSITPTDDNFNPKEGKTKEKLTGHLKDDDFFLVEEHPTAKYVIDKSDGDKLYGTLTIRGVSRDAVIENVQVEPEEQKASGTLVFDRKDFDVSFSHPAEDMVVSDDVEINVALKY